jgi:hypothetical protein
VNLICGTSKHRKVRPNYRPSVINAIRFATCSSVFEWGRPVSAHLYTNSAPCQDYLNIFSLPRCESPLA